MNPPSEEKRTVGAIIVKWFRDGFACWALSLFFLGMAMKLAMMHQCVNSLPYFDQWEAEAEAIYVPYYEHVLQISDFFTPQNEHRVVLTHLYDFVLLLLNRQWDSQLQMVVNAAIHCATVAGFAWVMAVLMGRRYWPVIWPVAALAIMSPFGWENALWGFQSQFYFLLLFSLLTIWLLGSEPYSRRWRWGIVAGACALLAMASGLLAAVAVGAVLVFEILKNPSQLRRHLPTLAVCAALAVAGLFFENRDFRELNMAHSLHDFFSCLGNNLSWPTGLRPWMAPLNLFPLLLLAWFYFRSPEKDQPVERMILGIGVWTILQSLATAIMRGAGGLPPAFRYMDTLCFLFIANILSVALLIGKYRHKLPFPPVWYVAFVLWLIPCVTSLWTLNERAWKVVIPFWAGYQQKRVELARAFLASNDELVFTASREIDRPWNFVPGLVFLLRTKDIPPILPACARYPLKVTSKDNAPSVFVPHGSKLNKADPPTEFCLGSYSTNGAAATGTFESAPMTSSLPYLEIAVAGNLGRPGLSLQLVGLDSGKVIDVKPPREPAGEWVNVDVKAPAGKFKLVARDDSATGWFAFKEPREMGRLSFWAQEIVDAARYFFAGGFVCLAAALGLYCLPRAASMNPKESVPQST
jgi:hypothetical protein